MLPQRQWVRSTPRSGTSAGTLLKDVIPGIPNGENAELQEAVRRPEIVNYPKSVDLLRTLIGSVPGKDFVYLDLFSAPTTAHAMRLTEDSGRGFIMVQLPEACGERRARPPRQASRPSVRSAKARIRRAGDRIGTEFPGCLSDIGFRVFRVDDGCRKEVLYPPEENIPPLIGQTVSNIREDRTDLDPALCLPAGPGAWASTCPTPAGWSTAAPSTGWTAASGGLF